MQPLKAACAAVRAAVGAPMDPHGYGLALLARGSVHASNGALYVRAPCATLAAELDALVPWAMLEAAAAALPENCAPTIAPVGAHVLVTGGGFSARLPMRPGHECAWLPHTLESMQVAVPKQLPTALKICAPFMPTENTQYPWAKGIRLENGYCTATDGYALTRARCWDTATTLVTACTLPAATVRELIRRFDSITDASAVALGIDGAQATFLFADGGVVRSQLLAGEWPRTTETLFAGMTDENFVPIPDDLLAAVQAVAPFAQPETRPLVHLLRRGAVVASTMDEAEETAAVEGFVPGVLQGTFAADLLLKVLAVASTGHFASPFVWRGQDCEGLLVTTRG